MRSKSFLTPLALAGLLFSCQQAIEPPLSRGVVSLSLDANGSLESSVETGENPQEDVPELTKFSLEVLQENTRMNFFETFEDCPSELYLPVGSYLAKAWYSDIAIEGFSLPAFAGESPFQVEDGGIHPIDLTCTLANVKVDVLFTESFRNYFTAFEAHVVSALDQPHTFTAEETRSLYVKPGTLRVEVDFTTPMGISSTMQVASLDQTQARDYYTFNLDVDASQSKLVVSFDSTTVKEPVEISISDEALTVEPPKVLASGVTLGEQLTHVELQPIDLDKLDITLAAKGGFESATMRVKSEFLQSIGIPEEVDFMQASESLIDSLKAIGLYPRGFDDAYDLVKIGYLDFTPVFEILQPNQDGSTHQFSFAIVDRNHRVSEAFSFEILSQPDGFGFEVAEPILIGSTTAVVGVNLDGDYNQLKFSYKNEEGKPVACSSYDYKESKESVHYFDLHQLPATNDSLMLYVDYKHKTDSLVLSKIYPAYTLEMQGANVWSDRIYLRVVSDHLDAVKPFLNIMIIEDGEYEWILSEPVFVDEDVVMVQGLTHSTSYTFMSTVAPLSQQDFYAQPQEFTTEAPQSIPNAGFESWYSERTDKNGEAITKNTKYLYWDKFFPWDKNNAATQGWSTLNQKTTQDGGTPTTFWGNVSSPYVGAKFVANSGTISTTDKHSGSKAALIRSVGWGSSNYQGLLGTTFEHADAGELFLGSLNTSNYQPNYGIPFATRPKGFSFYYKYTPKNADDHFIAKMVVLDAQGNIIGQATKPASECISTGSYTQAEVMLDYGKNFFVAPAKMYISFVSGVKVSRNGTDFSYPGKYNKDKGEFLGAQLWVDDVALIY